MEFVANIQYIYNKLASRHHKWYKKTMGFNLRSDKMYQVRTLDVLLLNLAHKRIQQHTSVSIL